MILKLRCLLHIVKEKKLNKSNPHQTSKTNKNTPTKLWRKFALRENAAGAIGTKKTPKNPVEKTTAVVF